METTITTNSYFRGADLRVSDGERSATLNLKDGSPAVEVKDRTMYHSDRAFSEAYDAIGEARAEALYEQAQFDFWQVMAPSIAAEHGFDESAIGQAGHMGGWLTVGGFDFSWDEPIAEDELPADEDPEPDEADPGWDLWRDRQDAREDAANARAEQERFFRFALDITAAVGTASEQYVEDVKQAARVGALVDACWRD